MNKVKELKAQQDEFRKLLFNYYEDQGMTITALAKEVNIAYTSLYAFLIKEDNLSFINLVKIKKWVQDSNVL